MKKYLSIIAGVLLVGIIAISSISCSKEDKTPIEKTSMDLKINIKVNKDVSPANTKVVKKEWENGDKIFVFFNVTVKSSSSYKTGYLDPANGYVTLTYNNGQWTGAFLNGDNINRLGSAGYMYAVYFPFGNVIRDEYGFKGSGHTNGSFNGNPVYSFYLVDETGSSSYTRTSDEISTLNGTLNLTLPDNYVYFYINEKDGKFNQNEKYRLSVEGVKPATIKSWETASGSFVKEELGAGKPMWGYKYGGGIAFSGIIDDTWTVSADHKVILFSDGEPAITKELTNVSLTSHSSVKFVNPQDGLNGWGKAMTAPLFTQMEDGLKWGAWNLGGTGLNDYGTEFRWGEIVTYSGTCDNRYVTHNLTDDYAIFDVARAYLGADWRMATAQEIDNLNTSSSKSSPNSGDVSTGHFSRRGLMCSTGSAPSKSILFQTSDGSNGFYWTSTYSYNNSTVPRYSISTGTNNLLKSSSAYSNLGVIRPIYLGSDEEVIVVPGLFGPGKQRDNYTGIEWTTSPTGSANDFVPAFKTTDNIYVSGDNIALHPHADAAETYFEGSLKNDYTAGNTIKVLYNTNSSGIVDYTTQDGSLGNVKDAGFVDATIASVSGKVITTNPTKIEPLQSIFRFTFKYNGNAINGIRFVRIFSSGNKLHTQYDVINDTPSYGPVTISRPNSLGDEYFYAGLRYDVNPDDPIIFQLFDEGGKAYSGIMNAPNEGFAIGKYYITTVDVHLDAFTVNNNGTQVCFSPGDYNGSSFSEPFAGIGVSSCYFNKADAITDKSVGGVSWRIPNSGSEINYIKDSRNMNTGVSRTYKVYIDKSITIGSSTTIPTCCLLIPPDGTTLTEAEKTELSNAANTATPLTDYLHYIGKGFVLLTRTGMFNKDNVWQTSSTYGPQDGIYRVNQTNKFLRFGPSTLTVGFISNTDKYKARVRYIHNL